MHTSEGILSGVQATCQVCQQMTYEPMVCAGCGRFGLPACLGKEEFFDFFCSRRIPQVTAEYATYLPRNSTSRGLEAVPHLPGGHLANQSH